LVATITREFPTVDPPARSAQATWRRRTPAGSMEIADDGKRVTRKVALVGTVAVGVVG
jgi:hypothetical protein